jgi:hydroxymethylbilane synthase
MTSIRVGTRGSALALWQARFVAAWLREAAPVIDVTLVEIVSTGDELTDVPLTEVEGTGFFTATLDRALLAGEVDVAVHSFKDVPVTQPLVEQDGLIVAAVPEREDPRDVLVVYDGVDASTLDALPRGSRVGTSSLRRRAQLLASRPDVEVAELRGNVPTRVRKVDEGHVHAAILAAAGLLRLGVRQRIDQFLDAPAWLPAPGQGAIAVQIRDDDDRMRDLLATIHHPATAAAVTAERAFLGTLEGGCQVPIGALATQEGDALVLHGLVADPRGTRVIRGERRGRAAEPDALGRELAEELLERGASDILAIVRAMQHVPAPQPE